MSQTGGDNFFTKLTRFVANPNSDWGSLDKIDLPFKKGGQVSAAELAPNELRQIRMFQRQRNRRIRKKEFALLRQVAQSGGKAPVSAAYAELSRVVPGESTVQAPAPAPAKYRSEKDAASGFDVEQINDIEQQMAKQWWGKDDADAAKQEAHPLPTIPKTQVLIDSNIAEDSYFDTEEKKAEKRAKAAQQEEQQKEKAEKEAAQKKEVQKQASLPEPKALGAAGAAPVKPAAAQAQTASSSEPDGDYDVVEFKPEDAVLEEKDLAAASPAQEEQPSFETINITEEDFISELSSSASDETMVSAMSFEDKEEPALAKVQDAEEGAAVGAEAVAAQDELQEEQIPELPTQTPEQPLVQAADVAAGVTEENIASEASSPVADDAMVSAMSFEDKEEPASVKAQDAEKDAAQEWPTFEAEDVAEDDFVSELLSLNREVPSFDDEDEAEDDFSEPFQGFSENFLAKVPVVPSVVTVEQLPDALHEPAILFAQEHDQEVERQLLALTSEQETQQEPEILLALLDFYRATRQENKFEIACIELVQHFDRSAPQYYTADLGQATQILSSMGLPDMQAGGEGSSWCSPSELNLSDVMLLRTVLLQQPDRVLLDWRPLQLLMEDAIEPLLDQIRDLASMQAEVLIWGGEHLLQCCATAIEAARARGDATYPLLWLLRLELVRIMYDQERFDNLALEYCIEMETSPPAWVKPRCRFIDADEAMSQLDDNGAVGADASAQQAAEQDADNAFLRLNLKHPLQWHRSISGGIQPLLRAIEAEATDNLCVIDCLHLDRMDTLATTELLAWLVDQTARQRQVRFVNVHRLLAVFWRVMGVTSTAQVDLRRD